MEKDRAKKNALLCRQCGTWRLESFHRKLRPLATRLTLAMLYVIFEQKKTILIDSIFVYKQSKFGIIASR